MTTEKNLREELLSQNGGGWQKGNDLRDRILAKDQAAVVWMKRLTIYSWILVGLSLAVAGMVRLSYPDLIDLRPELVPTFIIAWQGLLLIAVVFTIALYIRARTLTMHQIQSSLALIEEHLRKMSQKD